MKEIINRLLSSIVYWIYSLIIFVVGIFMKLESQKVFFIMGTFFIIRSLFKKPYHYNSKIKCFLFTILIFVSFFTVAKADFIISVGVTIIAGMMITGKGDIRNMSQYYNKKEEEKKYREMKKYIRENRNSEMIKEFEINLLELGIKYKERYKADIFNTYRLYFLEDAKFKEIKEELKESYTSSYNHKLVSILDAIFLSFNTFMIEKGKFKELERSTYGNATAKDL